MLNGAGDGEVGLLAGGGCARRGKRQRSDDVESTWTLQYFFVENLLDSLWTPQGLGDIFYTEFTGVPMDSMWTPYGLHVDSIWTL